jgi:hypothetical protein
MAARRALETNEFSLAEGNGGLERESLEWRKLPLEMRQQAAQRYPGARIPDKRQPCS